MGNTLHKNYEQQQKDRAMKLLAMFRRKIKEGVFAVETADWWSANMRGGATLRVDIVVKEYEDLEELP